jgi:hypothetical protein
MVIASDATIFLTNDMSVILSKLDIISHISKRVYLCKDLNSI